MVWTQDQCADEFIKVKLRKEKTLCVAISQVGSTPTHCQKATLFLPHFSVTPLGIGHSPSPSHLLIDQFVYLSRQSSLHNPAAFSCTRAATGAVGEVQIDGAAVQATGSQEVVIHLLVSIRQLLLHFFNQLKHNVYPVFGLPAEGEVSSTVQGSWI